jgi:hypothetical protein
MEFSSLKNKLDLKYYNNIKNYLIKNNLDYIWINNIINKNNEIELENTETNNLSINNDKTDIDNFSDDNLYKKPWIKLNIIHKILKIKEFINNIKMDNDDDKEYLKDELIKLVKAKILTKKNKVKYDEINGKIISLIDLQYKNGKYYYQNIE